MLLGFAGAGFGAAGLLGWLRAKTDSWRQAALTASVLGGGLLTLTTEVWSFGVCNQVPWIPAWWSVVLLLCAAQWLRPEVRRAWAGLPIRIRSVLTGGPRWEMGLTAALGLVVTVTAIVSSPNNYDAMTYRLPRVFHWIQQGSLAGFATADLRQLQNHPFAEYVYLNLILILGSDRWLNLVQTAAWFGILAASSLIHRELFPKSRNGWMAAVLCATLPMAVLQASSVQTDLLAAFWCAACAYFLLLYRRTGSAAWILVTALALGLACLTKITSYFFLAPFGLWALVLLLRGGIRRACGHGVILVCAFLALNAGHYARNMAFAGSPFGQSVVESYVYHTQTLNPKLLAANAVRNYWTHFQIPTETGTAAAQDVARRLQQAAGVDPDDPRITVNSTFFISRQRTFEDTAGNPLHALLAAVAAILLAARFRSSGRSAVGYASATVLGFLLISAALKWQVWGVRFHTTFFVLAAPWVVHAIWGADGRRRGMRMVALCLLFLSFYWALGNETRPWTGSRSIFKRTAEQNYFNSSPGMEQDFKRLTERIRSLGLERVGLAMGGNDWEYPFWALLRGVRWEHVQVDNASARFARKDFEPEAVVYTRAFLSLNPSVITGRLHGRRAERFGNFILVPEPRTR